MSQENQATQEQENQTQEQQEINPLQYVMMKIEMLESYVSQINTYVAELSKVNNNGWESYEKWSKRISQEMKLNPPKEGENFDFSVKRDSGIII